jgi:hypothetical protein
MALISRAEHAEWDGDLALVAGWIGCRVPETLEGSLHERLGLIILATTLDDPAKIYRLMRDVAFAGADDVTYGVVSGYVAEAWENSQSLYAMIMECWGDQKRSRRPRLCEGFRKPTLPGQPVPKWQQPKSDIAYVFGPRQSAADSAAAWGRDHWEGYSRGRRPWPRETLKSRAEVSSVCRTCRRFAADCELIFPLGHASVLDNKVPPYPFTVVHSASSATRVAAPEKPPWYPTHIEADQSAPAIPDAAPDARRDFLSPQLQHPEPGTQRRTTSEE